jgi:tetratricopeptide (TPR) repeat protein
MPAPLRMEYHLAVANCIERIYDFEDKIEKLAYHFYRSAKPEKSIKYLIRSAENAVKNYAVEDAIRYYEDCATLIKKPTEKIELFEKLADLLCIVGKYDDAIKTYSECSRMTYILDMKLQTGMLKLKIGNAYEKKSAYKDAERNYTEALELIKSAKGLESIEGAQIYNAIGWLYFRSANYDKAIAYSLKALSIAESHHFEREIGVAFHQIGTNYLRKGEYRLAEDFLKKALAIREAIDDINGISATYNTLGAVYRELGEHENALESFKKSLAINEKVGDNWRIATSYINIGNLHYQKGRLTDAEECYLKSLVIKESIGDLAGVGVVYNNLAIICYEKGKLEDAMQYYKKSMTIKETTKDTYGIALCCINLGILYKETNAYEDAIKYYKRGMELSQQIGEKYILAWCYGGLAEVYAETGNTSEGLEIGKKALSLAHQIDSPDMIGFTTRALAICYTRMAMWLDAEEHYKHCIEIYRQTGNELELAQSFYEYALMFKKRAERNDRNRAAHYLNIAKDIFYRNNASYGISKCEKILDELKTETEKLK